MDIKNKTIVIIGSAKSGVAAAKLAYIKQAKVIISDQKSISVKDIDQQCDVVKDACFLQALHQGDIILESSGHTKETIQKADMVVASPGVWRDALPLQWAREKGIPVLGEIEFGWRFCQSCVIAVTGSNGKTTTVTLIKNVLEKTGKKVALCGNIGFPFCECVLDASIDIFVIEISSFQLELIETFKPYIAVMTNFSQNHLDRHTDIQDYFHAKKRIFMNQTNEDIALLNAQDEWSMTLVNEVKAKVFLFNQEQQGVSANHLIAWEVGHIFGVLDEQIEQVFHDFKGVEHRLEKVGFYHDVEYINDSKSTTVESGRWAVSQMKKPTILMVGGSDKNLDYSSLKSLIQEKVYRVIAFGATKEKFKHAFCDVVRVDVLDGSFQEVMDHVRLIAQKGDCVLFSPMTASFDMFKNFEHRGEEFKRIVRQWIENK